jgi:hypothetical protein
MLTRCRYFAKNSLRHIPLFGYYLQAVLMQVGDGFSGNGHVEEELDD